MKKLLLVAAIAVFSISNTTAQTGFEVGVNFALPVGDAADFSTFSIGLDAAYFYEVSENFDTGVSTGFTNAFGDSVKIGGIELDSDDVQFIPIAAVARFHVIKNLYVRADIGYALGINDGNDGGFYYRPLISYKFTEMIGANISYTGISLDGGDWSTVGLGIEFSF
jgi:hypothetical protein